jgi:hypothetical protein
MNRNDLLKRIRFNGRELIDEFLPSGARAALERVMNRHEVDTDAFLMFVSVRALLRENGMASHESDREAAQVMALLNSQPA